MMRQISKRLACALVVLLLAAGPLFALPAAADNRMSRWEATVELLPDGSGIVTEHREMEIEDGTEVYISMKNLDGASVRDLTVSDDGQPYETLASWDVNASREAKAGHAGIVRTEDGVELCWGIGDYGSHRYEVRYTVDGLVRQLQDGQSLFWQFYTYGTGVPPEAMRLVIRAPFALNDTNARIWGFGYAGQAQFADDGSVVLESDGPLGDSDHVTALVQFIEGAPFTPRLSADRSLESEQEMAMQGATPRGEAPDAPDGDAGYAGGSYFNLMDRFLPLLVILFAVGGPMLLRKSRRAGLAGGRVLGVNGQEALARNKDKYFREPPYTDGPLTDTLPLLRLFRMGRDEDVIAALVLKWVLEGRMEAHPVTKERLFGKDKTTMELHFMRDEEGSMTPAEAGLWRMLRQAAGRDAVLEDSELLRWAKAHDETFLAWSDALEADANEALLAHGYLEEKTSGRILRLTSREISEQGQDLVDRLLQYKNYMTDFTLLNERGTGEVILWRELLIWAAFYGIADQVAKELAIVLPEVQEALSMDLTDLYLLHTLGHNLQSTAMAADVVSNASSGFGGGSFMGGGGGSFGGGGGGGVR